MTEIERLAVSAVAAWNASEHKDREADPWPAVVRAILEDLRDPNDRLKAFEPALSTERWRCLIDHILNEPEA